MRNVILCSIASLMFSTSIGMAAENFKFKTNPVYYDSEGTRGYSADIIPKGSKKVYNIVSTCEYYDPKMPAYVVTWFVGDDPIDFNFETTKHRFDDVPANYNRLPMEFYKLTCGKDKRFKKYLMNPDSNGEHLVSQ